MAEKTWIPTGNFAAMTEDQSRLFGALIGLARVCANNQTGERTQRVLAEALASLHRGSGMADKAAELAEKVKKEKYTIVPDCAVCMNPCGNSDDFNIADLRFSPEKTVYLKEILADMLIDAAPTALKMLTPGVDADDFFRSMEYGLFVIGEDFTDGGVYDAIEQTDAAVKSAEVKLHEFFGRF